MRRRLLIGLAATVLLVGGGWSAYWYVVAQRLDGGFAAWIAAQQAAGWTVAAGHRSIAGWPRTATLIVTPFRLVGGEPDVPAGVSWQTEQLRLTVDLLHPGGAIDVFAIGAQRIGSRASPGFPFATALTRLRIPLQQAGAPATVDLAIHRLRGGAEGLAIADLTGMMSADRGAGRHQPALALRLAAQGVTLPGGVNWPFGAHIAALSLEGELDGPVPPPRGPAADARAWRDGGGMARIHRLDLHWGPLDASVSGTASLDAGLQPTVTGQAVVSNYGPALDLLASRRIIGNDAALAAKAVLSLVAVAPDGNGPTRVTVPFTLRDGTIAVRGIPLVKLPELRWPQGS